MARKKRGVVRQDTPPPPEDMWVPIYSAKKDATIRLIALNSGVEGFWTHFHMCRTIPCIGKESGCICKTVQLAKRWKAYLGAWDPQAGRRVLAEITVDCHRASPHVFCASRDLRGYYFGLFRLVQRDNGPVRICLYRQIPAEEMAKLPPPLPVQKCLFKIWDIPE